jgi:hypothetical protein
MQSVTMKHQLFTDAKMGWYRGKAREQFKRTHQPRRPRPAGRLSVVRSRFSSASCIHSPSSRWGERMLKNAARVEQALAAGRGHVLDGG